jgi:hypothetical protein
MHVGAVLDLIDRLYTLQEHGQLIGLLNQSNPWTIEASFWVDFNKLGLLTNIPWIAALEEQEANLYLVMRKTPLTPIIWGRAEANRWKSADADTHQ